MIAILCKLNFDEISKKEEKEDGTNFDLLSRSRNTIGQLMKTYLYK